MPRLFAPVFLALAVSLALSGCLTPRAKVGPSAAVLEARQRVAQKTEPCQATPLAEVSPTEATFPYDDAKLDEEGARRVARVAAWLACHREAPVVILPAGDNHGDAAHRQDLATRRAQAVTTALRTAGASSAVVHMLAPGAPDPLTGPHIVVQAVGRGW